MTNNNYQEIIERENKRTNAVRAPQLYNMALHDVITVSGWNIRRVPGGWIYSMYGAIGMFIPFNNEYLL